MRLISFDALRTLEMPGVINVKPEDWLRRKDEILSADVLLFPGYWQVNALVYAWRRRIFPSINTYHLGHDKIEMTRAFEAVCPAHVPFTRILPSTPAALEQMLDEFSFPCVAKVVRSSMGQGVILIESQAQLREYAHANEILYIQERLPIHRDLRVVVIGGQVVTAYWRVAQDGRFHNNVAQGGAVSFEDVPDGALRLVERVAKELGVDHAGFDIAEVDGHFYLFEFNVRFGTEALNKRGIRLGALILDYLQH
ncbi:MAG: ATP-grasp domain-containing protein [Gammaproteobacteria bacterium]|nr:ATP-grasp domain-containing protein [Gammaproteobacteria bacterium]